MLNAANKVFISASKMLDEEKAAKVAKWLVYEIEHHKRKKAKRLKAAKKKKARKEERIALLGRSRYYLSELFGQWVIYL